MNSTNVPSNKTKNNPAPFCARMIPKGNELELPPKDAKRGISEIEVRQSIENGEHVIAEVGNSRVYENNQLVSMDSNEVIGNMQEGAYNRIEEEKRKRDKTKVASQDITR